MIATRKILIDLDCLFDLRLALINQLNPDMGVKLLHEGEYHTRDSDKTLREACGVDFKKWIGLYTTNYLNLLEDARETYLMHNIVPYTSKTIEEGTLPGKSDIHLTINFPFGYPTDEMKDNIRQLYQVLYPGHFTSINFISIPYSKLTLDYLYLNYDDYYCYHWGKWIYEQKETFDKMKHPGFRLHCPKWYSDSSEEIVLEHKEQQLLEGLDLFGFISYIFIPIMSVQFFDAHEVSIFLFEETTK